MNSGRRYFIREDGSRVEFADLAVGDQVRMCEPDGEIVDPVPVTIAAPSRLDADTGRWTAIVETD
jgi:hypothetical protein